MTTSAASLASPTVSAPAIATARGLRALIAAAITRIAERRERVEQRAHLAGMDDRMLKDIGITAVDATHEADKPFWKP